MLLCLTFTLISHTSEAQISKKGTPAYFNQLKSTKSLSIKTLQYEPVVSANNVSESDFSKGENITFAHAFNVSYNTEDDGEWEVSGDMRIWHLMITSPGAYTLNLIFDRYVLPQGAKLYLFNASGTDIKGAFTSDNNKESGILATAPVIGDTIIIEYQEPLDAEFEGELLVGAVNHDYIGIYQYDEKVGYFGDSGSCNIDVSCSDISGVEYIRRSVLRMIVNGTEYCTATLINNTSEDGTPYVITAAHCFADVPDGGETATFYFNYEVPYCSEVIEGNKSMIVEEQSISSASMRCIDSSMDYALLELSDAIPSDYRPYYAGWNLSDSPNGVFACIHHPMGDVKKISTFDGDLSTVTFNSGDITVSNGHWKVSEWTTATTEGGSSGSGIFDADNLLVGTLSGGSATCSNSVNDYFAKLNMGWDAASSSADQIKTYLDPENVGLQACTGYDPYGEDAYERLTNIEDGESPAVNEIAGDGGYISGHNINEITMYAEKYTGIVSAIVRGAYIMPSVYTVASTQTVKIALWTGNDTPSNKITEVEAYVGELRTDKEIYIEFDQEYSVSGNIFLTYEIEYPAEGYDAFAVYHSGDEITKSNNSMMMYNGSEWVLASDYYDISNTSLWIDILARNVERGDTSISTLDESEVLIGPNPLNSNILYITSQNVISQIELYNMRGEKVYMSSVNKSGEKVSVVMPELVTGVYMLKVYIEDKSRIFKLIKD